jgi:hypothetical protein
MQQVDFDEFWAELEEEFEIDLQAKYRNAWHRVKLYNPDKLTLKSWKGFCVDFELHRNRVQGWTEDEERDLLLKQLPQNWRGKVISEENRRKRTRFWATILGNLDLTISLFRAKIRNSLHLEVGEIRQIPGGFLLALKSQEDRNSLLELDGDELEDVEVKIDKVDVKMSGEEIVQFVHQGLKDQDDLERFESTMDTKPHEPEKKPDPKPPKPQNKESNWNQGGNWGGKGASGRGAPRYPYFKANQVREFPGWGSEGYNYAGHGEWEPQGYTQVSQVGKGDWGKGGQKGKGGWGWGGWNNQAQGGQAFQPSQPSSSSPPRSQPVVNVPPPQSTSQPPPAAQGKGKGKGGEPGKEKGEYSGYKGPKCPCCFQMKLDFRHHLSKCPKNKEIWAEMDKQCQ